MELHIASMLKGQKKHLSFHTPGHKRAGADITELSYSDNLFSPSGVIARAEEDVAHILGAKRSFLLTDGSTSGVHAMLYTLRSRGVHTVAYPAFSHPCVERGCKILGIKSHPIPQKSQNGLYFPPDLEEIGRAAERADALLLTSPDYYGFFAPLEGAKDICKKKNIPLVVDGAHGGHLHFSSVYHGNFADMWVDGVHKSLPAMTQGAVVSSKTEEWAEALREGVRAFRTTSPSYPIMASVEYAVKYPRNERLERAAEEFKQRVGAIKNDDWTKVVVPFGRYAHKARISLEKKGIYPEFDDGNYLLFYLSPCTREKDLKTLGRALRSLRREEPEEDAQGHIPLYTEE